MCVQGTELEEQGLAAACTQTAVSGRLEVLPGVCFLSFITLKSKETAETSENSKQKKEEKNPTTPKQKRSRELGGLCLPRIWDYSGEGKRGREAKGSR